MKTPPADLAERLWEVADRALQQGGELRIDDLAELTGVPRATLYYYFSGKDDVLAFLIAQQLQRGTTTITDAAARGRGGAAKRLEAVLRAMLQTMAQHPALCTRLMGVMATDAGGAQIMADVERTLMAPVRDLLVDAHESGELVVGDPTDTTLSLIGAVSIIAMVRTATNTFDPDEVADRLIPQFLDGLRPRDKSGTPTRLASRKR